MADPEAASILRNQIASIYWTISRNFVWRDLKFKFDMTLLPDLEASGLFLSVKAWLLLARLSLSFLGMTILQERRNTYKISAKSD